MFWSFRSIFNPTKNDWILIVLVDFKLYHHTPICTCLHGELGEKHILKTYAANRNPRLNRWTDGKKYSMRLGRSRYTWGKASCTDLKRAAVT